VSMSNESEVLGKLCNARVMGIRTEGTKYLTDVTFVTETGEMITFTGVMWRR